MRGIGDRRGPPILGFSTGAALALRIAARLGDEAGPLLLLSTAGPLDSPTTHKGVDAGERVFRAARSCGFGLTAMVWGQAMLARAAPNSLRALLFGGAGAADRAFADDLARRPLLTVPAGTSLLPPGLPLNR